MAQKVRVLVAALIAGIAMRPDDVANLPNALAKSFAADGAVDTNKDAVAYALSINGNTVIDVVAALASDEQRAALEAAIADATDDAVKADLQAQLAAIG